MWYDSKYHENIHPKLENLGDTIQAKMNWFNGAENQFWQQKWSYLGHKQGRTRRKHNFVRYVQKV